MTSVLFRSRVVAVTLGLSLGTGSAALAQQGLNLHGSQATAAGRPLNLLPPPGSAASQRYVPVTSGANAAGQLEPETALLAAPLPLPRPAGAPRAVITADTAAAPVAAGMASLPQAAQPQPAEPAAPAWPGQTAAAPAWPNTRSWGDDEPRDRVIIPGVVPRASAYAAEPQAAPAFQASPVAFAAPVPVARPGGETVVVAAAETSAAGTVPATAPVPVPNPQAPQPAMSSHAATVPATPAPVVLASHGSTATTMVIPASPAGALHNPVPPAVISAQTPARGPVLAALPPQGGPQDWPRFLPGTPGVERNTGIAGERVMPDPGVPLACLPAPVRRALNDVAMRFGPILVRSTHRGNGRFVRTNDWRGSYHRDCRAADFRVSGNGAAVIAFLRARAELGGVKRYRNGLIHIDDGPRRSW